MEQTKNSETKNRTFYTLRCGKAFENEETYPQEFDTFEEAYVKMVDLYNESIANDQTPVYWGIWRTTISHWNGKENSMTQACWSK